MSAQTPDDSPEAISRRDRAAIAAQACQTCRSRKSKCDEKRPKCGLCTRLNVACVYREPQPTKKDKTLVHILQVLERVESKVDRLGFPHTIAPDGIKSPSVTDDPSSKSTGTPWEQSESEVRRSDKRPEQSFLTSEVVRGNSHITPSHRILLWPSVFLMLTNAQISAVQDLNAVLEEGSSWFAHIELHKHPQSLPSPPETSISSTPSSPAPLITPTALGPDRVQHLCDAYFDTYNIIHPILDRDHFYSEVMSPVLRNGFDTRDTATCLALSVLALGKMAIEGTSGPSISSRDVTAHGIRGGTADEPPGLDIFNEARRRFGFVMHTCSIENVQIYLLQATYYEASARHMDYWRSCAAASMAFQILVRAAPIDWDGGNTDILRRVYWTCIHNEDLYHLELDLPRTGIYSLEDQVPLPLFQKLRTTSSSQSDPSVQFTYHFLAITALRRLLARIHGTVHSDMDPRAESSHSQDSPPVRVIKELARQLEEWRYHLPQSLQWSDNDAYGYPSASPLARKQPGALFSAEGASTSANHRYNLDIATAHLRSRYYHSRYLVYRPFVFKALHFPEAMTEEDAAYCALSIQSACAWPICMSPCKNKKRLIPYLFTWTQNFIGILLILRMTAESECLKQICEDRVNVEDMRTTVKLLLEWVSDMRLIDGMAEWSWQILEPLYANFR